MISCGDLDALATPYLDGEVTPADREAVDGHLNACPPCRARVDAEAAARRLIREHRAALTAERAPADLRARCCRTAARRAAPAWRRAVPLSVAATFLLVAAGFVLYAATSRSETLLAEQLTLDHLKCFSLQPADAPPVDAARLAHTLDARFGWNLGVPSGGADAPIRLIGARRCFYADGTMAHLLYRHHGQPVSLFLVPDTVRRPRLLRVLGHEALIWPERNVTCVLIAEGSPDDVKQIAAYVRAGLHHP
ncbi:MAG TPA: zf-HC2 domain-containing protein [Vicinamibacterales bacterium]|nr:zf-HC2 domain-containing protein [Vicinamibacterales bacterium]